MADNLTTTTTVSTVPSGTKIGTYKGTFSGDADVDICAGAIVHVVGTEGSRTFELATAKEDETSAADPSGMVDMMVYNANPSTASGVANGDYVAARGGEFGNKFVSLLHNANGTPVSTLNSDPYSATAALLHVGFVRKDTAASLVNAENDVTWGQVDANGYFRVTGPPNYATYATKGDVTITLDTPLTNSSARQSAVVDITSTGYRDIKLSVKTKGQASATGNVHIYVYTALAGATNYTGGASGSDAAYTAADWNNLKYLGAVDMNETTSVVREFEFSSVFPGAMPAKWGIIYLNSSGASTSTTAADHDIDYQGVY
jgi:hypothetical protein